jgi:hypothetical protein
MFYPIFIIHNSGQHNKDFFSGDIYHSEAKVPTLKLIYEIIAQRKDYLLT